MIGDDDMVRSRHGAARGPRKCGATSRRSTESVTGRVIRERRTHHIPDIGRRAQSVPDRPRPRQAPRKRVAALCADAVGGPRPRLDPGRALAAAALLRKGTGASPELRRSGGDRDPERAPVRRGAGAHARPRRGAAQQTATAEVLKVISRSVLDLDSVLQTLIDTAVRLARGSRGTIFIQKGDVLVASAFHSNVSPALREYLAMTTWRLDGDTQPARAAREGRVVHVPDLSKLEDETTQEVRKRAAYGAGYGCP